MARICRGPSRRFRKAQLQFGAIAASSKLTISTDGRHAWFIKGTNQILCFIYFSLEQLEDAMTEILQTVEQQSQISKRVERGTYF